MDCPIYNVAALLNVAKLDKWQKRADCVEMRRKGIDNLVMVAQEFILKKGVKPPNAVQDSISNSFASVSASASLVDSMDGMLENDDYQDPAQIGDIL